MAVLRVVMMTSGLEVLVLSAQEPSVNSLFQC